MKCLLIMLCLAAFDPNSVINEDGSLNEDALMEILETAEVPKPLDFPFAQWLAQPKWAPRVYKFPPEFVQILSLDGQSSPRRIEWVFEDEQWKPVVTDGSDETTYFKLTYKLETVELVSENLTMEFDGVDEVKCKVLEGASCDLTGDGKLDLDDWAKWASEYGQD